VAADPVGLGQVVPGNLEDPHDLLVEHDHAVGLLEHRTQRGMRVPGPLPPVAAVDVRADHVGLHRARPEQRDVHHQVLEPLRLELLEQLALAGTLDLEAPDGP
jgi:hypothetical protein